MTDTFQTVKISTTAPLDEKHQLASLLSANLDFHHTNNGISVHAFHPFPARFPPQLPRIFIDTLTQPGDIVLDPMSGSGTTAIETLLANRQAIGFDIDPLALLMAQVKTTTYSPEALLKITGEIIDHAILKLSNPVDVQQQFLATLPEENIKFISYWFAPETQLELFVLSSLIKQIEDAAIRNFFELVFSSIIITKSGGVSLAFDLAHTRPHRAKIAFLKDGKVILGDPNLNSDSKRVKLLTKTIRSALDEFKKRSIITIKNLPLYPNPNQKAIITYADAQKLSLPDNSVDLIVTSPPYASNAIDYMRAHKFSLVWMGYSINDLTQMRSKGIGAEAMLGLEVETLPDMTEDIIKQISDLDRKKGVALHRYYSEMKRVLIEMHRILKPGKAAIVVVGNTIMRNQSTQTHECLAGIGTSIGFEVPKIGVRHLDRNRRMLPVGNTHNPDSMIQQRMQEEYVIGFYKPREEK
jgi:DNA modification methylase